MIKCDRCKKRMFVDRQYSTYDHLEIFCISCGDRRFFHPPQDSSEGRWLLQKEISLAKNTIVNL